jgi:hypothetical protein
MRDKNARGNIETNTNLSLLTRTTLDQFQFINPSHHVCQEPYTALVVCLQTMVELLIRVN